MSGLDGCRVNGPVMACRFEGWWEQQFVDNPGRRHLGNITLVLGVEVSLLVASELLGWADALGRGRTWKVQ